MPSSFPTLSLSPASVSRKLNPKGAVVVDFGGYTQRGYNSINPIKKSFSVNYPILSSDDFSTLFSFITPIMGATSFYWTHPDTTVYEVVCTDFSDGLQSGVIRYNVSFNLEEV